MKKHHPIEPLLDARQGRDVALTILLAFFTACLIWVLFMRR